MYSQDEIRNAFHTLTQLIIAQTGEETAGGNLEDIESDLLRILEREPVMMKMIFDDLGKGA